MTIKKKRTRRAVKARRSIDEREAFAHKLYEEWWTKLERAMSKVQFYRGELNQARKDRAKAMADEVFGDE